MMMENEGLITQEDIDMISKNSAAGDFEKKEEMKSLSGGAAAGGAAGAAGGGAAGAACKITSEKIKGIAGSVQQYLLKVVKE